MADLSKFKKILVIAGSASFVSWISAIINFAANIIISRHYGEEVYAGYSFIFSMVTVLSVFATLGAGQMLIMALPNTSGEYRMNMISGANGVTIISGLILAVLMLIWLDKKGIGYPAGSMAAISLLILSTSYIRQSVYFVEGKVVRFQIVDKLIRVSIFLALIFLFSRLSLLSIEFVVLSLLVSYIMPAIFLRFENSSKEYGVYKFSLSFPRSEFGNSLSLFMILLMTTVLTNVDILLLGSWEKIEETAHYAAAQKISLVGNMFLYSVTTVVTPYLVRLNGKDTKGFNEYSHVSVLLSFFSILAFMIACMALGKYILALFGEGYSEGYGVLLILVASSLIGSIFGQGLTIMKVKGENISLLIYLVIAFVAKMASVFVLYQLMGIEGVAISSVIAVLVWNCACFIHLNFKYGIDTTMFSFFKRRTKLNT